MYLILVGILTDVRQSLQGLLKQLILLPGSDISRIMCPAEDPTLPEISNSWPTIDDLSARKLLQQYRPAKQKDSCCLSHYVFSFLDGHAH